MCLFRYLRKGKCCHEKYIFGWFYLIFLLSPILEIVGIRVLTINNLLYLLAWLPYVAVIDIDQTPAPDFLRETTALLAKDPKIGFIQVPQVCHKI